MSFFEEEIIFVLITKATYDAFTSAEKNGIINRSTIRNSDGLRIMRIDETDKYCFESIRKMAVDCRLVEFEFYNSEEIKDKLGI